MWRHLTRTRSIKMRLNISILFVGISLVVCGNVFAVSPYANTIQQNIKQKSFLTMASFPTTAADAGFIARMENKRDDYLPYFNRSAFQDLPIDEQEELEYMARRAERNRLAFYGTHTLTEYCENYPTTTECMNTLPPTIQPGNAQQSAGSIYPTITTGPYNNTTYMHASITPENVAKYNLKTHDGGCTPPERSSFWRNDIQTSGQYQHSNPAFEKFMITAFRKEGGCVNDPNDHGGYTCYGCASEGLCKGIDMRNITRAKVENLAFNNMYKTYNVDKLPDAFRGYAMWGIWGSGPNTGIKLFQSALGIQRTGKIDVATIRAAENYTGDFGNTYTDAHEKFYRNIVNRDPSQEKFLRGWLNSLELLRPSGCHVIPNNPIYR